ncbi:macrophage metalloelastase-like isoform X2 [Carcharodon carcharias]|uniref:macrophage metalloelastase-like isoform X2 n=1 Tax=Carcharodon carcharias TaxID=13397 RepID=UPI001B7E9D47|nr:macrophage metalloelastase-like isoform X2 [Carcharodon carcharias]
MKPVCFYLTVVLELGFLAISSSALPLFLVEGDTRDPQTTSSADIEIIFTTGDHGDNNDFDGPGQILAHAFGPGPAIGGDAHFDEDESWVTGSNGINLLIVATHEFGHSLGLSHSSVAGSVMLPFYTFVPRESFKLSSDDIEGIQSLYGSSAVTTQAPGPAPTQAPGPTSTKEPSTCDPNLFADAALKIGSYIFFKNGFYKLARSSRVIPVNSTWPSMVSNIDAAIRNRRRNNIVFFSGSQYWLFTGTVLNSGFPKPISDFGFSSSVTKIDAAIHVRRDMMLFFVGEQFWIYSTRRNRMSRRSPHLIRDNFTEISQVDAAFRSRGYFYLTSGPFVYKYRGTRLIARLKPTGWMNCP